MTSSHEEPISEPIAVRQAQFPGVPTSSISGSKTTTSPSGAIRAPQSDPPPSTTWPGGGIVASITNLEMSGNTNSPKPTAPRNRCFVEHLRANLERTGEDVVDELGVKKTGTKLVVDLPDAQAGHHCCDVDAQLDLMPLHPDQHDPKGPDGIHETVELIKRNGKSLLVTEIEMRAVAAATAKESNKGDDDVVAADFTVVSLKDAMTSKRIVTPGKGSKCTHIECFDLETFLRATLRATRFSQRTKCADTTKFPTCHPHHTELKKLGRCDYCKHWRCPICRQALSLSELEYDAFTGNILEKEPNAERVKVKPSTSEFWLEVVPVTAKPAPRNETDSDNTDSDDESPGPSREYEMRQKSSDTTEPGWKRETEHTLVMKSSKQGSIARTASEATETPRNGVDVIELEDSDDEAEGDVEMPQVHEQEEPSGPNSAPAVAAETGTGSIPTMATTNANKRASDDVDTSPPMDPRQPKIARRAIATIAPLDPVGAAARPTATTTTTVTVGAAPPIPKRLPPATVDEDLFRRVGAVLKTVQTNCDASTGTKWCQKASIPKTNEFRALEQLTKWMEALYDMTCKLTGQNRDSLKIALTSHSTGVHFQKFRKRVRLNKLLEPHNPVAPKIHNALELMAHTRNFWKAIVRREQLPKPLIKDGNGKFKVDPLEGWEGTHTSHKILLAFSCSFRVPLGSRFNTSCEGFLTIPIRSTQYVPIHPPDCLPIQKTNFYFQNRRC